MAFQRKVKEKTPMEKALGTQKKKVKAGDEKSEHLFDVQCKFTVDYSKVSNSLDSEDSVVTDLTNKKMMEVLVANKELITTLLETKRVNKYSKDIFYEYNKMISELYEADYGMDEIFTFMTSQYELNTDEISILSSFLLEEHRSVLREELMRTHNVSNHKEESLLKFF